MSLVSHVSCRVASDPFHTLSSFPDCFLACAQAISLPSSTSPFHHRRLKAIFFLCEMLPDTPAPRALFCLGINHNSAQRIKASVSLYQEQRDKGVIHSFNKYLLSISSFSVFLYSTNLRWGDTIMSKAFIISAPRESMYLHMGVRQLPNTGSSQTSHS